MSLPLWQRMAEERIRAAIESGAFDDLPGAGEPLSLEERNPYEGAWRAAFRLMKDANMAPRWIELDRDVRLGAERLRRTLQRAYDRSDGEGLTWERAVARFREEVQRLNRKVHLRNQLAPRSVAPRFPLRVERELREVTVQME